MFTEQDNSISDGKENLDFIPAQTSYNFINEPNVAMAKLMYKVRPEMTSVSRLWQCHSSIEVFCRVLHERVNSV